MAEPFAAPDRASGREDRGRAALIVAHPGHELRLHGWLEATRPTVQVLTDGSGRNGKPRLDSTRRILDRAGAMPGGVFGRLSDSALYEAIIDGQFSVFTGLAEELAELLEALDVELVVGDASEGYNPGHDACRLVIDAAVALANRRRPRKIANYDFTLCQAPDACPEELRSRTLRLELGEGELGRKLHAANGYSELADEVGDALATLGADAFRVECMRPVGIMRLVGPFGEDVPYYERHGEARVASGKYARALRYRAHMLPLERKLRSYVERKGA